MTNDLVLRGAGLDCVGNLLKDGFIRPMTIDGELYGSIVDLMEVFGETDRPRKYWSDRKKALLAKDRELSESIGQLKLRATDGKMRTTDVAPLWACVMIVLLMDTPRATEFKKRIAKFTATQIKYRLMNVSRGLEWAADTIHEEMAELDAPEADRPYIDWGYVEGERR